MAQVQLLGPPRKGINMAYSGRDEERGGSGWPRPKTRTHMAWHLMFMHGYGPEEMFAMDTEQLYDLHIADHATGVDSHDH